jgi:hypothetical protein
MHLGLLLTHMVTINKVLMVKHVSKKCHNNFGGAKSLVVIFSSFVNLLTKLISLSLKHIKRLLNELLNL